MLILIIIAQEDYNSTSLNVTFHPGESEKTVRVPIINNLLREDSESFYGNLTISYQSEFLLLPLATTRIEILYNDCK